MENYIEPDKVYVLNKNEVLLAVFDKDDEEPIINPQVEKTQNAESVFTFAINPNNPKWIQINNPENLYVVDGKVYSTNFEGCFSETISENNEDLVQVTAYERQKLLSRKFVRAWNSETGFEVIDSFMVVILSNGDLPLKNNGTVVNTTHQKGTSGYVLEGLLYGTGWSVGTCDVQGTFDFETEQVDIYENILKVQQTWGGILVFDSVNKIVHHRDETVWLPYNGYEVKYQKNMQSLEKLYNNKIITKLCPLGEGGLNIKSANNNSEWLTNYTYTDTVLEGIENNPDISDAEQLKRWGQRKLQDLCKPRIELTVKAVLLYQVEGYELERVDLNDIVDVINFANIDKDIVQLRVVGFTYKIWDYSDATLELSDITLDSTDIFKKNVQATSQINNGTLSANQVINISQGGKTVENSLKELNTNFIVTDGKIEGVIQEVDGEDGIVTRLSIVSQTLKELNSKIQEIANITISGESEVGNVTLINVNEGEPIIVKIHPKNTNIAYLYPRTNLYPSATLFMTNRKILFRNTTTNENFYYELPEDLLYYDENTYDEFSLYYEERTCKVKKKVGYNADGTIYVLQNEEIHSYSYPTIELTAGNYEISLPGYNSAFLSVTLMAANYYTTQFATNVKLKSEITQTVNNINLSVEQKLSNYSTTTQMNAAIDLKADQITSTVSETYATKNTTNTLSSRIKQTAKSIELSVNNGSTSSGITITTTKEDGSTSTVTGTITMTGLVKFTDLSKSGSTTINGANITTGKISAARLELSDYLKISSADNKYATINGLSGGTTTINGACITTGIIKSSNYSSGTAGTSINLSNGVIDSKNFKINSSGNVTMDGTVTASAGKIGGFTLGSTKLYNGKSTLSANTAGVYIGTDGISLGTGSTFKVTSAGELTATSATITGTINATAGNIGGATIANGVLTIKNANIESINGNKITNGTLSGSALYDDTISSGKISDLNSDKITWLDSVRITCGTLGVAGKIDCSSIEADFIDALYNGIPGKGFSVNGNPGVDMDVIYEQEGYMWRRLRFRNGLLIGVDTDW